MCEWSRFSASLLAFVLITQQEQCLLLVFLLLCFYANECLISSRTICWKGYLFPSSCFRTFVKNHLGIVLGVCFQLLCFCSLDLWAALGIMARQYYMLHKSMPLSSCFEWGPLFIVLCLKLDWSVAVLPGPCLVCYGVGFPPTWGGSVPVSPHSPHHPQGLVLHFHRFLLHGFVLLYGHQPVLVVGLC